MRQKNSYLETKLRRLEEQGNRERVDHAAELKRLSDEIRRVTREARASEAQHQQSIAELTRQADKGKGRETILAENDGDDEKDDDDDEEEEEDGLENMQWFNSEGRGTDDEAMEHNFKAREV